MSNFIDRKEEFDLLKQKVKNFKRDVVKLFDEGLFTEYLNCISYFYDYSPRNILLIQEQCPHATCVASISTWNKKGFRVKKGAKAIKILCPIKYVDSTGKEKLNFRFGNVFDISQVTPKNPAKSDLKEEVSFDLEMAFESLMLDRENLISIVDKRDLPDAYGDYNYVTGNIRLRRESIPIMFRTLLHEKRHAYSYGLRYDVNRSEIIAECSAYVASCKFGIQDDANSLVYVGSYCKDKSVDELDTYLNEIVSTSRKLIHWVLDTTCLSVVF